MPFGRVEATTAIRKDYAAIRNEEGLPAVTDNPPHEWGQPLTASTDHGPEAATGRSHRENPTRRLVRPPPPVRRRVWPWVMAIIVGALVLLSGCVAIAIGLTRGPVQATNSFVALLDNGQFVQAHQSLCTETRSALTEQQFRQDFSAATNISDYGFTPASAGVGSFAMISGTITVNDEIRNISFELRREDDEWRVCSYDLIQ